MAVNVTASPNAETRLPGEHDLEVAIAPEQFLGRRLDAPRGRQVRDGRRGLQTRLGG